MSYTAIPSIKGQITIPPSIRQKYKIDKKTPIIIEDAGNGIINLKVMKMMDYDAIQYYENDHGFGLRFKDGIDPRILIDAIKKIDG